MSPTFARFAALQQAQRDAFGRLVALSLQHVRQSGSIGAHFIAAVADQQQEALREWTGVPGSAAFAASQIAFAQAVAKHALPHAQQFYDAWLETQKEAAAIAVGVAVSPFVQDGDVQAHGHEVARSGGPAQAAADASAKPLAQMTADDALEQSAAQAATPDTDALVPAAEDSLSAGVSDTTTDVGAQHATDVGEDATEAAAPTVGSATPAAVDSAAPAAEAAAPAVESVAPVAEPAPTRRRAKATQAQSSEAAPRKAGSATAPRKATAAKRTANATARGGADAPSAGSGRAAARRPSVRASRTKH